MDFTTIDGAKSAGFAGFVSLASLRAASCRPAPEVPGVYLVLREPSTPPQFLARSGAGQHKRRDPTVAVPLLKERWIPEAAVLYVGKGTSLRERISAYVCSGWTRTSSHWGGRLIWQLAEADQFLIAWRHDARGEPRETERELIGLFVQQFGARPFANWSG